MRLPARTPLSSPSSSSSSSPPRSASLSSSGATVSAVQTTLYSSISPSSGFIPASFDADAAYAQVFIANEDGVSVVSSSFAEPCRPSGGDSSTGFYSGVMNKGDIFTVQRTDVSQPLFFYSPHGNDCANGLVGVLNPSFTQSLSAYAAAAKSYGQPGVFPSSTTPYGGVLTPLKQSETLPEAAVLPDPSGSSTVFATTLPVGVCVGIAVACVAALGIALGGGWFLWTEYARRKRGAGSDVEKRAQAEGQAEGESGVLPEPRTVEENVERAFSDAGGPGDEMFGDDDNGDLADEKIAQWRAATTGMVAIGTMSVQRSTSFLYP